MNPRFLGLLIMCLVSQVHAATMRVVTWDLESPDPNPPKEVAEARLQKAASFLQRVDAEVVLLQSVAGWSACQQLVKYLQPKDYRVLVCSSSGSEAGGEVAILAKHAARVSWSQSWSNGAGFAFAVLPLNKKKIGLYSVRMPADNTSGESGSARAAREKACRELLTQIEALTKWQENRVDLLTIGGDFATSPEQDEEEQTLSWLEDAGLANAYHSVARENRLSVRGREGQPEATWDYIFVRNGAFVSAPSLVLAEGFSHRPVAVEIDPERVSGPTAWVEQVRRAQAEAREVLARAQANAALVAHEQPLPLWPLWAGGILVALAGGFSFWWWRLSVRLRASPVWALAQPEENAGLIEGLPTDALPAPSSEQGLEETTPRESEETAHWRERAEAAERRAAEATHVIKQGMLPPLMEWFKQRVIRRLISQRSDLMDSQEKAKDQVHALQQQVARIHGGMQDRIQTYERRIRELERELAHANAAKRELIAAQIRLTKEQLERARQEAPQRN
jgi:hypothetical protein